MGFSINWYKEVSFRKRGLIFSTVMFKPGDVIIPRSELSLYLYRGRAECFPDDWENEKDLLVVGDFLPIIPNEHYEDIFIPVSKLTTEVPTNKNTGRSFRVLEADLHNIEVVGNVPMKVWRILRDYTSQTLDGIRFRPSEISGQSDGVTTAYDMLRNYFSQERR